MENETASNKVAYIVKPLNTKYYGNVSIYSETLDKLKQAHREEFDRLPEVYKTIENPERVYQSKTNSRSIVVVNDRVTSSNSGSPLWVIVKRVSDEEAILTSAYFNRTKNPGPEL
jgi:hypothetical protein